MRRAVAFAVGLLFLTTAANAQDQTVCQMGDVEPIASLEDVKALFLKVEGQQLVDYLRTSMGAAADSLLEPLERIRGFVPNGFETCRTVLHRKEIGGLVQEVSVFYIPEQVFPMALYLSAIPTADGWIVAQINFDTSLGNVMDSLR